MSNAARQGTLAELRPRPMPTKKDKAKRRDPTGTAKIKEVNRLIRLARSHWDAHNNRACRATRTRALELYESLPDTDRAQVPQPLRVWLRYRSEKYFGDDA